jgi:kynurenine formamidase
MKWKTFVIGWVFALAILLMAQRRSAVSENAVFKNIVDLTHSVSETSSNSQSHLQSLETREYFATHLDAPAHSLSGMWTVDQIPAERLVRPLVVLDVSDNARQNADYLVSIEDIARHEELHGAIPPAAVVVAYTGWSVRWNSKREYRNSDKSGTEHFPGFSLEAARFLVEARQVVGIGIDTLSVDRGDSKQYPVHKYCAEHSVYHLENVANLMQAPATGAIAVVTPMKLEHGSTAPTRVLALVK